MLWEDSPTEHRSQSTTGPLTFDFHLLSDFKMLDKEKPDSVPFILAPWAVKHVWIEFTRKAD